MKRSYSPKIYYTVIIGVSQKVKLSWNKYNWVEKHTQKKRKYCSAENLQY